MYQKQPPHPPPRSSLKIGGVDASGGDEFADKTVPFILATHRCVLSSFFPFFLFLSQVMQIRGTKSRVGV